MSSSVGSETVGAGVVRTGAVADGGVAGDADEVAIKPARVSKRVFCGLPARVFARVEPVAAVVAGCAVARVFRYHHASPAIPATARSVIVCFFTVHFLNSRIATRTMATAPPMMA
jgi:hypothetical protein